MKIIETKLNDGTVSRWEVPSPEQAIEYAKVTNGMQWDPIERKNQSGGLPMVWKRVDQVN